MNSKPVRYCVGQRLPLSELMLIGIKILIDLKTKLQPSFFTFEFWGETWFDTQGAVYRNLFALSYQNVIYTFRLTHLDLLLFIVVIARNWKQDCCFCGRVQAGCKHSKTPTYRFSIYWASILSPENKRYVRIDVNRSSIRCAPSFSQALLISLSQKALVLVSGGSTSMAPRPI